MAWTMVSSRHPRFYPKMKKGTPILGPKGEPTFGVLPPTYQFVVANETKGILVFTMSKRKGQWRWTWKKKGKPYPGFDARLCETTSIYLAIKSLKARGLTDVINEVAGILVKI